MRMGRNAFVAPCTKFQILEQRRLSICSEFQNIFVISNCKFRNDEDGEKCCCLCCPCSKFQITFSTLKANFRQELHLLDKAADLSFFLDDFKDKLKLSTFVDEKNFPSSLHKGTVILCVFIQLTRSVRTRKELSEKFCFF